MSAADLLDSHLTPNTNGHERMSWNSVKDHGQPPHGAIVVDSDGGSRPWVKTFAGDVADGALWLDPADVLPPVTDVKAPPAPPVDPRVEPLAAALRNAFTGRGASPGRGDVSDTTRRTWARVARAALAFVDDGAWWPMSTLPDRHPDRVLIRYGSGDTGGASGTSRNADARIGRTGWRPL